MSDTIAADRLRRGDTHFGVIQKLEGAFGATVKSSSGTNVLRCAGVAASCTWSKDHGLLNAWQKNATLKLAEPIGGYGRDR